MGSSHNSRCSSGRWWGGACGGVEWEALDYFYLLSANIIHNSHSLRTPPSKKFYLHHFVYETFERDLQTRLAVRVQKLFTSSFLFYSNLLLGYWFRFKQQLWLISANDLIETWGLINFITFLILSKEYYRIQFWFWRIRNSKNRFSNTDI